MSESIESLVLDLLEWIGPDPRDYQEALGAWRTSCPRLPVWEEASDRGLIMRQLDEGAAFVLVTPRGRELLEAKRPNAG